MAEVKIDRRLNLVVPVYRDDGSVIYVHSMPISRQVFEAHFMPISKAWSDLYMNGMMAVGSRVAALMLKSAAEALGVWDGPSGVKNSLLTEIHRLTNVVTPVDGQGWQTIPYEDALSRKLITEDDASEVENALCFFTLASWAVARRKATAIIEAGCQLWGAQTTFSNVTEFSRSLPISTPVENTGAKTAPVSLVPY